MPQSPGQIIRVLDGRQITYFEFTTALALLWFAEKKVDMALLEVGLGGRLDATNVVTPAGVGDYQYQPGS